MTVQLKSVTRTPAMLASAGLESAEIEEPNGASAAVTTTGALAPTDITDSSRRRLVVGKSNRPLWSTNDLDRRGPSFGLESVIDLDERTRIVSTQTSPWKYVCALSIESSVGFFVGTAWVVAPQTLITAGHCVFDQNQMGGWATAIDVTPGRDRELIPFRTHRVVRFSTVDLWQENQDPDFDIAALHLEAPIFAKGEGFRVGAFPNKELMNFMVNISGYPAAPGGGQEQWWAKNRIRAVTPRRIFYDVDTSGGQSGGPAFIMPDENSPPTVVGIHAYGLGGTPASIPIRVNSAPRIIPEVVEQIQSWIDNGPSDNR